MIKVYIAGPITGHPSYRTEFNHAEDVLRLAGVEPLNPADVELHEEATWQDYMRATTRMLTQANEVCLLPGWETSKGAQVEHAWATALGIPVRALDWWERKAGAGQ